jgi:lipoprotein-releasing system permease protein
VFVLDAETDSKYLIAPIEFTRRLLDYPGMVSGVAVKLRPGADPEKAAQRIAASLGEDFKALTRYRQKASLYRIMRSEKWSVFLISALVMLIASFSIIGSMVMLVIDKRGDVRTLVAMGATVRFIRRIFTHEGMLMATGGAAAGMILGVGFSLAQQHFGIIKISSATFLADSYPVIVQWSDLLMVAALFAALSYLIVRSTVVAMVHRSIIRI